MWRVFIHRSVRRFERRHPDHRHVVTRTIGMLEEDPYQDERLSGRCRGLWRLRLGELRVIYRIDVQAREAYILRAGLRENVYEGLCQHTSLGSLPSSHSLLYLLQSRPSMKSSPTATLYPIPYSSKTFNTFLDKALALAKPQNTP